MSAPVLGQIVEPPAAVRDLALRLGARQEEAARTVRLTQVGRMKRALGQDAWMSFRASQMMSPRRCEFAWRAHFGPLGLISVCDALQGDGGRLDVTALGVIPIARTARTAALTRGELMRYLAELAWAPEALLANRSLRWRVDAADTLVVGAGHGETAVEVTLCLDGEGRIGAIHASDRPRSSIEPILPTPWRGRFSDYRRHLGHWLPFAGEVAWVIDGREEVYWRCQVRAWRLLRPGRPQNDRNIA